MTADILSDPTYPHGTAEGFTRGCRGSRCPAPVACKVVHLRYHGDFAFRRAIDTGTTPAEFIAREQPAPAPRATTPKKRSRRVIGSDGLPVPATEYQRKVKELVTVRRFTDRQVADALGKTRDQAAASRKALGLPANRSNTRAPASSGASSFQESA